MLRTARTRSLMGTLAVLSLSVTLAACGDDEESAATTQAASATTAEASPATTAADDESPTTSAAPAATDPPVTEADALEDLVARAEAEGELTIYSEMAPGALEAISAAFETEYPAIDVEFVRDVHPNLAPAVELESEGNGVGDIFITTNTAWFETNSGTGLFLELEGPELTGEGEFDPSLYVKNGDYFVIGGTINVFAWNTGELPDGISGLADLLDPALDGRIGIPDPLAPVNVDWYTWFEENSGLTLEDLAALNPRIYQSAVPLNEGLVSGEIAVTPYAFPTIVGPSQAAGAPIEFDIPEGSFWGAPYNAAALASAPHPAAAMLFLNFAVTRPGQEVLNNQAAAVLPDAALAVVADMAPSYGITEDDLVAFQERFRGLFVG